MYNAEIADRIVTGKGEPFYYFSVSGSDYEIGPSKGRAMDGDISGIWRFFEYPTTGRADIANGFPCLNKYQTFQLQMR